MKNSTYKFMISLLAIAFLGSCEDKLDQSPISAVGSNAFYNSPDDFDKAMTGVYNILRQYPINHFELSEVRSDNLYAPGTAGVRDYNLINNFNRNLSTTSLINDTWNDLFNGVMRANTLLDNLDESVVPDQELRERLEGEARFVRALLYFDLIRFFGKVPLFDEPTTPLEALEIPRSPVTEVYDLIIEDFTFAANNLPSEYPASDEGRVTDNAAKGMLARVYMTRSAPQLHPDGPTLGTDEWEMAQQLLNEIINSGNFSLLDEYESVFAYGNQNNREIVFDIHFNTGGMGVGAEYVQYHYPETYARANGIPFPGGTFPDAPKNISDDMFADFQENDPRLEFSIHEGFVDQNGNVSDDTFIKKYLDLDNLGIDRFDFDLNFPVIRFADILLMKAEALARTNGSQTEIDQLVNQIRARVGLDPLSGVTYAQIMEERRREFLGEGLRWHDLVRSGNVLETMNSWVEDEDGGEFISDNITENDLIYPVPINQLDVKPGLYAQNPGY